METERRVVFSIRLAELEHATISEAAGRVEMAPSTWARLLLLRAIYDSPVAKMTRCAQEAVELPWVDED